MPELPEVETVARGLQNFLTGCTITGAEVLWARSVVPPDPQAFAHRIAGQRVTRVGRRGKWIVIVLDGRDTLLVHLRMTGRLVLERPSRSHEGPSRNDEEGTGQQSCTQPRLHAPPSAGKGAADRHLRVLLLLDDGRRLCFFDQRKFGRMVLTTEPQKVLSALGPEPLVDDLTVARLGEMLAQRRGRIKPLLLNQRFLAGLGNIYTDEALWHAGVHPLRRADSLSLAEVRKLHQAIRSVLRAAIVQGGTTLPDAAYQQPDGSLGEFSHRLAVYGREGQPCPRCGTSIQRIKVSQRGTHFCPRCQPSVCDHVCDHPEDEF
jgi:formamidopyrimidine-DNA glycosylase